MAFGSRRDLKNKIEIETWKTKQRLFNCKFIKDKCHDWNKYLVHAFHVYLDICKISIVWEKCKRFINYKVCVWEIIGFRETREITSYKKLPAIADPLEIQFNFRDPFAHPDALIHFFRNAFFPLSLIQIVEFEVKANEGEISFCRRSRTHSSVRFPIHDDAMATRTLRTFAPIIIINISTERRAKIGSKFCAHF